MKQYEQSEIDQTRGYFERQEFPVEEVNVEGIAVPYFVIPQELMPSLPDFAFRMTRTDPEAGNVVGIFGVSDSVPEELRTYWALHEIIEFMQIGIDQEGRCAQAEELVVAQIPVEHAAAYIEKRKVFFEKLCIFFQSELDAQTGSYTEEDLHEAEASLHFLNSL
ncbi:MAG: hypothetical protein NUV98_06810 [Candidatus Roizmanbacteria bacterium]|nr:hypothetical protein [Candidatus Roizmanbacteria bacterium]